MNNTKNFYSQLISGAVFVDAGGYGKREIPEGYGGMGGMGMGGFGVRLHLFLLQMKSFINDTYLKISITWLQLEMPSLLRDNETFHIRHLQWILKFGVKCGNFFQQYEIIVCNFFYLDAAKQNISV